MTGCNPQTLDEARAFVAHVQSLFMPWNIPALVAGFTEDCVVRFGDLPELCGKAALEKFFRSRSERQQDYRLKKELRALSGDTIANYWEGEWQDRATGKQMAGRGVEIWLMREGKIAVWEAAFNFNEVGRPSAMGLTRGAPGMLFQPKCKECSARCSSIEVLGPGELAAEWESWPQERRDQFAKRRSPTSHYLIYEGPGGGNGWGDEIPPQRAAAILAAIANPTPETMRAADFYDRAGMCDQCAEFYCPRHWSISETGYGRCPRGHGKSLDPHWHP